MDDQCTHHRAAPNSHGVPYWNSPVFFSNGFQCTRGSENSAKYIKPKVINISCGFIVPCASCMFLWKIKNTKPPQIAFVSTFISLAKAICSSGRMALRSVIILIATTCGKKMAGNKKRARNFRSFWKVRLGVIRVVVMFVVRVSYRRPDHYHETSTNQSLVDELPIRKAWKSLEKQTVSGLANHTVFWSRRGFQTKSTNPTTLQWNLMFFQWYAWKKRCSNNQVHTSAIESQLTRLTILSMASWDECQPLFTVWLLNETARDMQTISRCHYNRQSTTPFKTPSKPFFRHQPLTTWKSRPGLTNSGPMTLIDFTCYPTADAFRCDQFTAGDLLLCIHIETFLKQQCCWWWFFPPTFFGGEIS